MKIATIQPRAVRLAVLSASVFSAAWTSSASATIYPVINPGFESPDASAGDIPGSTGWATPAGNSFTSAAFARTGTQAGKGFGNPGLFQQTIAVTDPVGTSYTASAYAGFTSGDPLIGQTGAFINMTFVNATGGDIATVFGTEQGVLLASTDPADTFKLLSVNAPSLEGTAFVRINLVIGPYNGSGPPGAGGAAFFDDAALVSDAVVPEPASLGLLGAGAVALVCRRRRA